MDATLVSWLDNIGRIAFFWSVGIFVVVNAAAALTFALRSDRALVNRWTSRILAIDLLLLGTGAGIPLVTTMTSMTVSALASGVRGVNVAGAVALERGK